MSPSLRGEKPATNRLSNGTANWPPEITLKYIQLVPHSKHFPSRLRKQASWTLYSEITATCSEIHTDHVNTPCGQKVEFFKVKPDGTQSNHWAVKD
jgi:hypothetical protein